MKDLGKTLGDKTEIIVGRWISTVYKAGEIHSAKELTYSAVRDSLPAVLIELAKLLSRFRTGNPQELEYRSIVHGCVRAQQGYDAAEVVREYRLLREVILDTLEPDLLTESPREMLSAIRLIDYFLHEIINISLEGYIEERLVELRQMHSQLMLTNQELLRLLQVQKDNLSFMAHELKNPLNSIIGHSHLLLQKQRQALKAKDSALNLEQLERVLRNGRKLLQIVNDSLEISRYSEGHIQLHIEPVNTCELLLEILEDVLIPEAEGKGLQLIAEVDGAPAQIMTDAMRLQQVVTNLVSNAIRYTEAGTIRVICQKATDRTWSLKVIDTGIGIAPEDQERIFEPYTRGSALSQSANGSGLGLAIVKQIVNLMKGSVELKSQVGEGTEIILTLPLTLNAEE